MRLSSNRRLVIGYPIEARIYYYTCGVLEESTNWNREGLGREGSVLGPDEVLELH